MKKSKQKKDGSWITPRAAAVDAEYRRLEAQALESGDSTADSFALYQAASGGYDTKHRVFGLGNAARELLTPPTTSRVSQSSGSSSYTPTVVSQFASKNAQLERTLGNVQLELAQERAANEEARRRQAMMERLLQEQFGWNFDPSCGPGGPDGGGDMGGGSTGGVMSLG